MALSRNSAQLSPFEQTEADWKQKMKLRYELGGFYGCFSNHPASGTNPHSRGR